MVASSWSQFLGAHARGIIACDFFTVETLWLRTLHVVERMTLRGTHLGEFMGVAPTGKAVSWTAIAIYRLEEGRIAECWVEPNLLGLALQTGVVSMPRGLLATGDQGQRVD